MKKRKCMVALTLAVVLALMMSACSTSESSMTSTTTENSVDTAATEQTESAAVELTESSFPEKNITCVWSSKVGSGGDILLRNIGTVIDGELNGNSFVVENRTGSGGAEAFMYVNDSDADGYTLLGTSASLPIANLVSDTTLGLDDFEMVCGFMVDPQYIYCPADAPYDTLEELIEYASEHPGEMNWGRSQSTSVGTVTMAMVVAETGIEVSSVVFDSGTDLFTAVLGGHVDVGFGEYGDISSQIEAGNIKALAVFEEERTEILPDVATAKEQGYDLVIQKARGIAAPKGTSEEVIEELQRIFKTAYESEEIQEYIVSEGGVPVWMDSQELYDAYADIANIVEENLDIITG